VTVDEYLACLHGLGLTPFRMLTTGATLYKDRDGDLVRVIDPDEMDASERAEFISLLKTRMGVADH